MSAMYDGLRVMFVEDDHCAPLGTDTDLAGFS
jgi:hypothetical protein